ncbi:retinoblastoma-like protein 1 isoform X2 [Lycorma delicatula]|uniref:retinoblastoma-like protein 1 isoform X2 n=1 Tax=Lycorma delicatula TaxID=130591 RepID=UPI003F51628D
MGLAGDGEETIFKKYQTLCNDLNMDKDAANKAWNSYETIMQNYSLEGDQLHWLGCALHVACRKATPPTVGQSSQLVEGNLVSLTRLLRLCKLSFIQFINKIKKWADMTNLSQDFRTRVERLERNFAVSTVIFKKFQPIFSEMFHDPLAENHKQQRSKKQRNMPCTLSRLFEFTWTLFICVKAQVSDISDDLVNSYHLLLACCDLIYMNAVLSDRRDLLNNNFSGLPQNFNNKDYTRPSEPQCIIHDLCENHDGILMEAKSIKEYCWKSYMRKFFEKKIIKGNSNNFSELLDPSNFEHNLKSVNKFYEEYVLSVGDFDERIFLGDDAGSDIGTPAKIISQTGIDFAEKLQAKRITQSQNYNWSRLTPGTPLTGRDYLKSRDPSSITPVSTATQSVSRLQNMISGHQASPSLNLQNIIANCTDNPQIEERVTEMGNMFCAKYTTVEHLDSHIDFAKKRLHLATCLYYKLLENILTEEMKKPNFDCNNLLSKDIFHQTLFACCLEIVMYSYNSQRTFPWVLEALNVESYHFYKIIEIIVRAEDQLSRDMVKHLNLIEEQILESLAWRSNSPLWTSLQASELPVPTCEDVSLPHQLSQDNNLDNGGTSNTPMSSVSERFQSPVTVTGLTKKRLFLESATGGLRTVKPGQSLLQNHQPATTTASSSQTTNQTQVITTVQSVTTTTNSISINNTAKNSSSSSTTKYIPVQAIEVEDGRRYIPIAIAPGSGSVLIQTHPSRPVLSNGQTTTAGNGQNNSTTVATTAATTDVTIPATTAASTSSINTTTRDNKENKRPRRTGSLGLFFRKFYHLASVRMQELCNQLTLMETDLRRKIWTCFEHTIVEHTDLMLNRHLDQILMCAVYVICKIVGTERTFTEIMRCYRLQPQCVSNVYRSVLLSGPQQNTSTFNSNNNNTADNSNNSSPSLGTQSDESSSNGEVRGDLIRFYNTVYVMKVQPFVMRFSNRSSQQNENLTLSPLPVGKSTPMSPRRRISDKHSVYIRPLMTSESNVPPSPVRSLAYCFSRSPAKDLRAINTMIQVVNGRKVSKRLLTDDIECETPAKQQHLISEAIVTRKVQGVFVDRLAAKTQD